MKPHPGTLLTILLGFFSAAPGLEAETLRTDDTLLSESPAFSVPLGSDNIHWETIQLIHQDARRQKLMRSPAENGTVAERSADLLILDRMVVTHRPAETLPPPMIETNVQKLFRTGTIAEHVGAKVTTHFWLHPDLGLRLSFEF